MMNSPEPSATYDSFSFAPSRMLCLDELNGAQDKSLSEHTSVV